MPKTTPFSKALFWRVIISAATHNQRGALPFRNVVPPRQQHTATTVPNTKHRKIEAGCGGVRNLILYVYNVKFFLYKSPSHLGSFPFFSSFYVPLAYANDAR